MKAARKTSPIASASRWFAALAPVLVIVGCGALVYLGAIWWLKREFASAAFDLAHSQAQESALRIARALPETVEMYKSRSLPTGHAIDESLDQLTREHQNVVAAMIVDAGGRVASMATSPNSRYREILWQVVGQSGLARGTDEASFARGLREAMNGLEPVRVNINDARTGEVVGWLSVYIDPQMPMDLVEMATSRLTRKLGPILLVMILLSFFAIMVIRRQRLVASRLRAQRDEAERLAHVGALAAGLAHEIRNPVNALAMQLEMLEEDLGSASPSGRIERIRGGLRLVERTVHEFLNFAMPGQQQPVEVDLATELAALLDATRHNAENPEFKTSLKVAGDLRAWCDPNALRQIMGNLFSNALRIQRGQPAPRLHVEAFRRGPWARILVEDAGPGVAPENRDKIFDCFYTTNSDGTGLGLAIARRLAQLNGGELELLPVNSVLGGANFMLTMPTQPLIK